MTVPTFLHPYARPASERFVTIVRGEGATVYDDAGNAYVDALASLWYCNVGHGRGEIADAVATQMRRIAGFHTFDLFTNQPADEVCELVAARAPLPDARVFLTSGGSEAVDTALKIARAAQSLAGHPDRTVVVSRRPSYHGVTYGAVTATGLPANQEHFGPLLPDVVQVAHDDLDGVRAVFAQGRVGAVLAEPVVGAGGVYPPAPGYLQGLRELCDEHGAWLILDEVICGFGRLGSWWGAEHYGVTPDLVTFAKGVTSGYQPLGGVIVGPAVRAALESDPGFVLRHGHTYSGHPAACAAAPVALGIVEDEQLVERVPGIAARFRDGLEALLADEVVADVRGEGGIWAAGMPAGVSASAVRDEMLDRGVIARPIGEATIAFCPPLVVTDAQLDQALDALGEAVRAVR